MYLAMYGLIRQSQGPGCWLITYAQQHRRLWWQFMPAEGVRGGSKASCLSLTLGKHLKEGARFVKHSFPVGGLVYVSQKHKGGSTLRDCLGTWRVLAFTPESGCVIADL